MSAPTAPKLLPEELFEKREKRDSSRLRTYNQLLNQIYQRIYTTSQINGNSNYILFTVPPFIFGLPKIELQDCILYLVHMLRQATYEVRYTYPNLLFISWKHHEKNYLLNQNPIVQAMTESNKKDKKKATKVSFNTVQSSQKQEKSNVLDYQPPNSFVQNIQTPLPPQKNFLTDLWNI